MAKKMIPDPLKRRHLIEQELDESQCLAIADAYAEEGRVFESLQFLVKAGATDRLAAVADAAMADGDAFLFKQVADILGKDQGAERWAVLAAAAEDKGFDCYVGMARRHARTSEE
jgi:hypothetical protein